MDIEEVKKKAFVYFGDASTVDQWLNTTVLVLGNRSPRQTVDDGDIELVLELIERLKHGMTA